MSAQARPSVADEPSVKSSSSRPGLRGLLVAVLLGGCSGEDATWPPAPRNAQERLMVEAAQRAVDRYDGWSRVLFVVEHRPDQWRVQAWKVVNPQSKGRGQCVPWGVRSVILNEQGEMLEYQNHL